MPLSVRWLGGELLTLAAQAASYDAGYRDTLT